MPLREGTVVLIADDEDLVREVTEIMIEENGGKTLIAKSGLEAIEVYKKNQGQVACVILDFSMPVLNGYDTYLALREVNPSLPVIFVSGLKATPEIEDLAHEGKVKFLAKPYKEADLIATIEKAIG